jgi:hypothetical protein
MLLLQSCYSGTHGLDCLLLYVVNVHIGLHYNEPRLSPNAFTNGEFILSNMLILAITPSTMYRHFPGYIPLNVDSVHMTSPLRHEPCTSSTSTTAWEPWDLQPLRLWLFGSYNINIGQAHGALRHIIVQIMEIPWGTR